MHGPGLPPIDALTTPRLRLRTPVLEDAPVLFREYAQDPEVTRFLLWTPHADVEVTRSFLRLVLEERASAGRAPFVIERRADGRLLGMIDAVAELPRVTLGYVLAREHWGRGYATEAVCAVLDWALAQPGVERVCALCDAENGASARVLEKAGLLREGVLLRFMVHPAFGPGPRDSLSYAAVRAGPAAPRVLAVDHVQLSMPPGGEAAVRDFYGGLLGLRELARPADMQGRPGCWFGAGAVRLHFGVEADFRPARKAHPALVVSGLAALLGRCAAAGHVVTAAPPIAGAERAHVIDPFGNRVELLAAPER